MKKTPLPWMVIALSWIPLASANATELVPMGKALAGVLGTSKAFKKTIGDVTFYYSKGSDGRHERTAFIDHETSQESCLHTWVVGLDREGKVLSVVAQERQCPAGRAPASEQASAEAVKRVQSAYRRLQAQY